MQRGLLLPNDGFRDPEFEKLKIVGIPETKDGFRG
jgi:hypothetical protein